MIAGLYSKMKLPIKATAIVIIFALHSLLFPKSANSGDFHFSIDAFLEGTHSLVVGDEEMLAQVQRALERFGFNPGPIDGVYGQLTEYALVRFQKNAGLERKGLIDVATLDALGIDGTEFRNTARSTSFPVAFNLIKAVQLALIDLEYEPGSADGLLGLKTESAIGKFQEWSGLPATGKIDAQTLNALGLTE